MQDVIPLFPLSNQVDRRNQRINHIFTTAKIQKFPNVSTNFVKFLSSLVSSINGLYRCGGLLLGFAGVCTFFRFPRYLTSHLLLLYGKYEIRLALLLALANIRRIPLLSAFVIQFIGVLKKRGRGRLVEPRKFLLTNEISRRGLYQWIHAALTVFMRVFFYCRQPTG